MEMHDCARARGKGDAEMCVYVAWSIITRATSALGKHYLSAQTGGAPTAIQRKDFALRCSCVLYGSNKCRDRTARV